MYHTLWRKMSSYYCHIWLASCNLIITNNTYFTMQILTLSWMHQPLDLLSRSHPYDDMLSRCDLICNKGPLLVRLLWSDLFKGNVVKASPKTVLYICSCYVCTATVCIQNCFRSVLRVVPFHKSGHNVLTGYCISDCIYKWCSMDF